MRAPVVFSGEQTVTEAAVRRRTIMTHLTDQATSGHHQEAYCELDGSSYTDDDGNEQYPVGYDLADHALAFYRFILRTDTDAFTDAWYESRHKTREHLRSLNASDLDGSEFQGFQTIVFGVGIYRDFAESFGVLDEHIPSERDVRAALDHVLSNIGPEGRRREHIDEFVELLNQAAAAGYLEENVHHRVFSPKIADEEAVAFHMPSVFPAVKKYVREFNMEEEVSLLGKNDYVDSFRDKAEKGESYPLAVNHRVRNVENGAKCVVIDPHRAVTVLPDGFNLGAFTEESAGTDDEEPTETPVLALSRDGNPYATVTVHVDSWQVGPDGSGIAEMGTVSDETGHIDVVDFFGCDVALDEGEYYRLENVRVSTYEGALQLEIVRGVTEATPIQPGAGTTAGDDPDSDRQPSADATQSSLDETPDDDTAAADGGERTGGSRGTSDESDGGELLTEDLDDTIQQWTTAKQTGSAGADRAAVVTAVADDLGIEEKRVEGRIDTLLSEGRRVYEPTADTLEVL